MEASAAPPATSPLLGSVSMPSAKHMAKTIALEKAIASSSAGNREPLPPKLIVASARKRTHGKPMVPT